MGGGLWTLLESGLKVLVDGRDVGHDALPVRPLGVHHVVYVLERRAPDIELVMKSSPSAAEGGTYQSAFDAHTLCSLESQGEVSPLGYGQNQSQ